MLRCGLINFFQSGVTHQNNFSKIISWNYNVGCSNSNSATTNKMNLGCKSFWWAIALWLFWCKKHCEYENHIIKQIHHVVCDGVAARTVIAVRPQQKSRCGLGPIGGGNGWFCRTGLLFFFLGDVLRILNRNKIWTTLLCTMQSFSCGFILPFWLFLQLSWR